MIDRSPELRRNAAVRGIFAFAERGGAVSPYRAAAYNADEGQQTKKEIVKYDRLQKKLCGTGSALHLPEMLRRA